MKKEKKLKKAKKKIKYYSNKCGKYYTKIVK